MRYSGNILSQKAWEESFCVRQMIILWRKLDEMRERERRIGGKEISTECGSSLRPPSPILNHARIFHTRDLILSVT